MKDFIARFKKAWAAFVRTWKFEKDIGSTTERVREEVEYAINCERNSAIEENDDNFLDYAVECYRSATQSFDGRKTLKGAEFLSGSSRRMGRAKSLDS